ncbi:VOC family protein [Peredibacter sp. HCB2-198]|uniref:VOC family protein n=1 Tax=Peredibacter sp. HCB2-198 TaxID=3383025 RepID=UPI0038B5F29C
MKVKRIVANIKTNKIKDAKRFYEKVLGLDSLMDLGWISTYGSNTKSIVQISIMKEGGSGAPVPDLSIEVDDVDEAYKKMKRAKFKIEYDIADEPWGVRRFFVRDPFGKLVNILSHS